MPSGSRGSRLSEANGTGAVSHGERFERRRPRAALTSWCAVVLRRRRASVRRGPLGVVGASDGVYRLYWNSTGFLASGRGR